MVSIACLTYNHEKYIADAIESFLMQKTNFKYEILLHDDASTDKTADIIRVYENKYPDLIKTIYQSENQYSKGVKIREFYIKRAKGKYIALCEGDDFWTDPYKLQKQVDYMESHPDCSMCVHAAYRVNPNKKKLGNVRPSNGNKNFSVEEVIEGGGGLFATNSIVYLKDKGIQMPAFYENAPVGDYPLAIYLALKGRVYYIDEFMSAYRVGVCGSWTMRTTSSVKRIIEHYNSIAAMLDGVNQYTEYKYNTSICNTKRKNEFDLLMLQERFMELKEGENKALYDALSLKNKLKIFIKQFPIVAKPLTAIKRKYKAWIMK